MKRPPALKPNDIAVILSPAGNIDGEVVQNAFAILEEWELRPQISEFALCNAGRFSGSVEQRLSDLQNAFDNPDVKLILCSRGGYGMVHLLEALDFSEIKANLKWVVGYSDITLLHAALQYHGIASLHGPMAQHFSDTGVWDISVRSTLSLLTGESLKFEITLGDNSALNRLGKARGRLFGGNLSVFCSLLGTPYMKIPKGGILFIEDIGEAPYRVDRMIQQLKLAGVFDRIGGLVVGQFTDYEEDPSMYANLFASLRMAVDSFDFPLCFDFPSGHDNPNFPLIMGEFASLNVDNKNITFEQ